jgi:hypothetical protein
MKSTIKTAAKVTENLNQSTDNKETKRRNSTLKEN